MENSQNDSLKHQLLKRLPEAIFLVKRDMQNKKNLNSNEMTDTSLYVEKAKSVDEHIAQTKKPLVIRSSKATIKKDSHQPGTLKQPIGVLAKYTRSEQRNIDSHDDHDDSTAKNSMVGEIKSQEHHTAFSDSKSSLEFQLDNLALSLHKMETEATAYEYEESLRMSRALPKKTFTVEHIGSRETICYDIGPDEEELEHKRAKEFSKRFLTQLYGMQLQVMDIELRISKSRFHGINQLNAQTVKTLFHKILVVCRHLWQQTQSVIMNLSHKFRAEFVLKHRTIIRDLSTRLFKLCQIFGIKINAPHVAGGRYEDKHVRFEDDEDRAAVLRASLVKLLGESGPSSGGPIPEAHVDGTRSACIFNYASSRSDSTKKYQCFQKQGMKMSSRPNVNEKFRYRNKSDVPYIVANRKNQSTSGRMPLNPSKLHESNSNDKYGVKSGKIQTPVPIIDEASGKKCDVSTVNNGGSSQFKKSSASLFDIMSILKRIEIERRDIEERWTLSSAARKEDSSAVRELVSSPNRQELPFASNEMTEPELPPEQDPSTGSKEQTVVSSANAAETRSQRMSRCPPPAPDTTQANLPSATALERSEKRGSSVTPTNNLPSAEATSGVSVSSVPTDPGGATSARGSEAAEPPRQSGDAGSAATVRGAEEQKSGDQAVAEESRGRGVMLPTSSVIFLPGSRFSAATHARHLLPSSRCENVLSTPNQVIQSVESYGEKFQEHLLQSLHTSRGHFDPWKLVELVADSIAEELVADVALEISQAGDFFVQQLFDAEFSRASAPADSSLGSSSSCATESSSALLEFSSSTLTCDPSDENTSQASAAVESLKSV